MLSSTRRCSTNPPRPALADTFKVLGDPTRVRILDALSRAEVSVCDLAELLGLTQSAVSHQLRLLRSMRLVRSRRDGRHIFYIARRPSHRRAVRAGARARAGARRGGAMSDDLHRLRAARRVDVQDRGDGLPRRGRDPRAAVQEPDRARGFLRRPDGPAAAREIRRRQDLDRGDRRRRRRHRDARVARSRGAGGRQRSADAHPAGAGVDVGHRARPRHGAAAGRRWPGPADAGHYGAAARSFVLSSLARVGAGATARKAWTRRAHRVARHQRADDRRGDRRRGARATGPRRPRWCSCSPSRRRSRRGPSSAPATPSAR